MTALLFEAPAVQCQMAHGCCRPDVMHGPYHRFTTIQYFANALQRQHALVHPVQMDDVGLLEFLQLCDVGTTVGNVHLKQVFAVQVQPEPHDEPFPQESQLHSLLSGHRCYRQAVCLLVAHQHLGLHTVVVQCLHEPTGSHRSATRPFTCINYEYSHAANHYKVQAPSPSTDISGGDGGEIEGITNGYIHRRQQD